MREDPLPETQAYACARTRRLDIYACVRSFHQTPPPTSMPTVTGACPIISQKQATGSQLSGLHFPIYKLDTSHTHNLAAVTPRIRKR